MAKHKKKYRSAHSGISITGAVVASIASPMIQQVVEKVTAGKINTSYGMVAIGYYLSKKGGITGQAGTALFYANADNVIKSLMGGFNIGGLSTTSATGGAF